MANNGNSQWGWPNMEELLQCPVCLDIPAPGIIEQCRHGHHVCANCKKNVVNCPLCKCDFLGTRNFAVEEIVRHFNILKNAMLLNNIVVEATSKKKDKSKKVTPSVDHATLILKKIPKNRATETPNCTKGTYPCRAADCDAVLPACRLLNHARTFHQNILSEGAMDFRNVYKQTFEVPSRNKKLITKHSFIIFISGVGLVYFNIEIMRSGQVAVFLQKAAKYAQCVKFLASLEFYSEANNYIWHTTLVSTRHGFDGLMQSYYCFTLSENQFRNICDQKKLKCRLTFLKRDTSNVHALTPPNKEQIKSVARIRTLLLSQQQDKKLIQNLENPKKQQITAKTASLTSQDNGRTQNNVTQLIQVSNLKFVDPKNDRKANGETSSSSTQARPANKKKSVNKKKR